MFCKNCGKEIAEDSRFCNFCGYRQKADDKEIKHIIANAIYTLCKLALKLALIYFVLISAAGFLGEALDVVHLSVYVAFGCVSYIFYRKLHIKLFQNEPISGLVIFIVIFICSTIYVIDHGHDILEEDWWFLTLPQIIVPLLIEAYKWVMRNK